MLNAKRIDLSIFPERSDRPNLGLQFFAEPATEGPADPTSDKPAPENEPNAPTPDDTDAAQTAAELKRLQAELVKQKNALDNATKEAASYKKQLRASKTAEEQLAEKKEEETRKMQEELAALKKETAIAKISKRVMAFAGDEETANSIASSLYGAEDADAAVDAFAKVLAAKEKALRLEFGKLPAPSAGTEDGPTTTREEISKMNYRDRLAFAKKYPETYQKIMN